MNRTDRLHAIGLALHNARSRGRTATWLAERFEVSTRTIKRDIAALIEAGVAIRSQDGRGGGYQLMRDAALPPVSFTAGEATALTIALAAEPEMPFSVDGEAVLQKILGAMSKPQQQHAAEMGRRVWMRRPTARRRASARTIDMALATQTTVLIDYRDGSGRYTKRRPVEPMALVRTKDHWHLLAWCQLRRAGRWFRLDRITRATRTKIPCKTRQLLEVFGAPPDDARPVVLP